jgi:hypothetical protein
VMDRLKWLNSRLFASVIIATLSTAPFAGAAESCSTMRAFQAGEVSAEKTLLKRFPARFTRSGHKLVIKFANNTDETFVDGEAEKGHESSYQGYVLIGYRPHIGFHGVLPGVGVR